MIEILFKEGAASSMQVAKSMNNHYPSSTFAIFHVSETEFPTPEELARMEAKVEGEYRKKREKIIPMEGNASDIACFPLNLSVGDISEPFSDQRADFLQSRVMIAGEETGGVGRELVCTARKGLEKLRTASGPFRIWTSRHPDELCGFCHILSLLPDTADVRVVELPEYEVYEGEIRTYSGWSDVDCFELGRFQVFERSLADAERSYYKHQWRELQKENGPLRATISGRICSVDADFYDWLILRELAQQPESFHEARLIGTILGKYPLGLGDFQIALRIEEFISQGMLTAVTVPEAGDPIYHRYLKKG